MNLFPSFSVFVFQLAQNKCLCYFIPVHCFVVPLSLLLVIQTCLSAKACFTNMKYKPSMSYFLLVSVLLKIVAVTPWELKHIFFADVAVLKKFFHACS